MKKRTKVIITVAIILVVLAAGAAVWLLLGGSGGAEGEANVFSVKELSNSGSVGLRNRYAGIVEAQEIVKIELDAEKTLSEVYVKEGESVNVGDNLFAYDINSLELAAEQLEIDLLGIENGIETMEDQKKEIEAQLKRASKSDKVELTIQLQTLELNIKQEEYNRDKKQLEIEDAEEDITNNVVTSEIDGVVRSINMPSAQGDSNDMGMYGYFGEQDTSFMTLMSSEDYRIKGTISEQTAGMIFPEMPVIVRSRVDETVTWSGVIENINYDQTETSNPNMMYGGENTGEMATKYPFYIRLDSYEGLMMGQHVFIEPEGGGASKEGLWIPAYYLIPEEGQQAAVEGDVAPPEGIDGSDEIPAEEAEQDEAYVYAQNAWGNIEKRKVLVGERDDAAGTVKIIEGLTPEDYIAFPDETVKPGMKAVRQEGSGLPDVGLGMDMGAEGVEMPAEQFVGDGQEMEYIPDDSGFEGLFDEDSVPEDGAGGGEDDALGQDDLEDVL